LKSFRSRLFLGAIIFSAGLLAIGHMTSLALIHRFPHTMALRLDHRMIVVLALVFLILGLLQVRRGLSPFDELRTRLAGVRSGREQQLEGRYPSEVEGLVEDLNGLLVQRDLDVRRALEKAGDLAHGLKTPLAVLTNEVKRAEEAGQHELAAEMRTQLERMRRQIEYHLAQARAAGARPTPGVRSSVRESANGLARALLRLHADRGLAIEVQVADDVRVRVQSEDLDEMLGNLLDNACKWARTRIVLTTSVVAGDVLIAIDDDGDGVDPAMFAAVLQRGVRADEAAPGSGFGLAIVRDLAELYGGAISLTRSDGGGVRAALRLPQSES